MRSTVLAVVGAFLLALHAVAGLEMVLDPDVKILPGGRTTCGVLRCEEQGQEPRLASVTEMAVFKRASGPGGLRARRTVATVSERQAKLSTLWDGIKVDGTWSVRRAQVTLYLTEADDCKLAEFSCRVVTVDGFQETRVGLATLGRDVSEHASRTARPDEACTPPAGDVGQLAALALQSSTSTLLAGVRDNLRDLENRLEDKISALGGTFARQTPARVDASSEQFNRLDKSVAALAALSDQLAAAVGKAERAAPDSRGAWVSPGLGGVASCTRREAGYQLVLPGGGEPPFLCDPDTDGGGWVLIQRRSSGRVNFLRSWAEYKRGFGSLADDFWLGNERIHALTAQGSFELLVTLRYGNQTAVARYQDFSLGDEAGNYKLHLGVYSGTAGDALSPHNGFQFSTIDRDNDVHETASCAAVYHGAWWYGACHSSNLNGEWGAPHNKGPRWSPLSGADPVDFTEMKIRRL
ncbi:hypothetical protein EGW08_019583 [Elysia chlorotica]|uniref:Fibrinogen C-terminal domain-containing protein n=1 Tax=Elysia chlorotica TaxID=188477 RepID=A0A433STQ9_ELYCH|nr:hypothetical protein EGW08_019583 [Elysia chlorotica]